MSVLEAIAAIRIVPVVVIDDAGAAAELADALAEGGIACAEITLRTSAGLRAIAAIGDRPGFTVGAGTVLSVADLEASVDAGARFVVSPGLDEGIVRRAEELGVLALPGVATATELQRAHRLGLSEVKFFPADRLGGPETIASLAAPFPGMRFMPSGGVTPANAADYLAHPRVIAVSGSWMASRSMIAQRDFGAIARVAAETCALVADVGAGGRGST